ncbi:prepilin-type N-terminal cleavage/methylation domain-containing protein [Thermovibrio sp.]
MKGYSLFELVVVLAVLSLILSLSLPHFYKSSLSSLELFENRFKSSVSSLESFGDSREFCVNFKDNSFSFGKEVLKSPYQVESLVMPFKLVNRELSSSFCFTPKEFSYFIVNVKEGEDSYLTAFVLFPSKEVKFLKLNEAQEETIKDKVLKGRISEWFSYY